MLKAKQAHLKTLGITKKLTEDREDKYIKKYRMKNLKHLRIFEDYQTEEVMMDYPEVEKEVFFTTETDNIKPTDPSVSEGNYVIMFTNSEGQDTTLEIAGAASPKYKGDKMVSPIEVIKDSSSDGKNYSVVGHYREVPESMGQYELERVVVEEI